MNFIYNAFTIYNALNNIRYLSEIDFKNQIQNSQKMVYLILGHPVGNLFNMASPFQSHKCEEDVDRHTAMGKMCDQY